MANCSMNLTEDITGLTVIYGCVFVVGLPANLLSLWGLFQLLCHSNVLPIFILNLLVSDLIQLVTLPFWVSYLQKEHRWDFGEAACNIVGFIFYVNLYASVVFMCLVAIDRYIGIVHPMTCRRFRTAKSAVAASFGVWLVSFLYCLFGLLPSVYYERQMCMEVYPVGHRYAVFKIGTIVFGFLLPCFILGFVRSSYFLYVIFPFPLGSLRGSPGRSRVRGSVALALALLRFREAKPSGTVSPHH